MKNYRTLLIGLIACITFSCVFNKKEQKETAESSQTGNDTLQQENTKMSPRHQEWVNLKHGNRELQALVVYPETDSKTKAVIVIHENRGLNEWAQFFADKLAAEGFLVIAPDFISNTREGTKRTSDFENPDAARDAIYDLDPSQVTADLDATYEYIKNDHSSTGEVAVVGFCWGGSQTFQYATHNNNITTAHVFYGTAPDDAQALARINAPVYGYYGGNDNRVNSTIAQTETHMKAVNKEYEYEIYEGAGHAFMKNAHQDDASAENKEAHDAAWERLLTILNYIYINSSF